MLYRHFFDQLQSSLKTSNRLVLGLSGGLDSRVLLHLLAELKQQQPQLQILAVHVHHGLSDHADAWLQQCQQWAQQSNIDFVAERVQLELGSRVSLEQAAREARYQALAKHIDSRSILLTAHHQGDQLETFLLALKRGSGPKGLSAMAQTMEFAAGQLVRPLLSVSRQQLHQYATEHQLDWVEDESNADTRFDRNFIRHNVAPVLKQRWPNIEKSVARSAALCAQQESLLKDLLYTRYQEMLGSQGQLAIEALKGQSQAARGALLRLWLQEQGFAMPSEKQLLQLWQDVALAQSDAAPIFCYGETQIGRHQNCLWVFEKSQDASQLCLEWPIEKPLELPDSLGRLQLIKRTEHETAFEAKQLGATSIQTLSLPANTDSLRVVFSATGIHAHPEGRQHGRALKKLLQEWQIPTWQRHRIPFVVDGNELVAAANLCVGQAYSGADYQLIWYRG